MSEGVPYADLIILALIAGFILLRLRSVLGTRNDTNNPDGYFTKKPALPTAMQEPIVQLDDKSQKAKPPEENDPYLATLPEGALRDAIGQIKAKDANFTATSFLQGAKGAFEMVFDAFAKGDRATLGLLLAEPVLKPFAQELDQRAAQEHKTEPTLVSVQAQGITAASLDKNLAHLTVHFSSEQISVVRNAEGAIIEGDPSQLHHVEDHWQFERDVTSKNPNWKVVET